MPREDKHKHTTAKTPALLLTKQLKFHFASKLCQEGLFPKWSRWLHPETMRRERAALLALKADVDAGRRTMEDVQRHYQCFIASAEYSTGDGCIRDMDAYYTKVFRARPVYKRSRRYLYGKKC